MTATQYYIGVDIGGTTIKAALIGADFEVLHEKRSPTARLDGPAAVIDHLLEALRRALDEGRRRFGAGPLAVGVAALGLVDETRGVALASAAVGWRDVSLRTLLEAVTSVPVAVGHDLRAGALAEAQLGAGQGHPSFLFITIGTGVGGAVVLDGIPLIGGFGRAGEIGHLVVHPGGIRCGCGAYGCLETVASATAIETRFHQLTNRALGTEDIVRRVRLGDPRASRVWSEAIEALADALTAAVLLLDPAAIIVGGGVSGAGDTLFAPLGAALARRVTLGIPPPLLAAHLGDRAGVIGAGLLASRLVAAAGADQP